MTVVQQAIADARARLALRANLQTGSQNAALPLVAGFVLGAAFNRN